MRNQEIIRKAEMSLSALKSGGLMNPAQASAFIRMVQNTPTIFSESRVIQMENDSQKFEKSASASVFCGLRKKEKHCQTTS